MRSVPAILAAVATLYAPHARAQDAKLAQELSNPVASLISFPFQFNYDTNIGPANGSRVLLNIQPVIPFDLNEDWNLISRTIIPVVWQTDVAGRSGDQFGLSDTVQSLFLSPKEPGPAGIIWGVGPVFLLPTGTDDLLGSRQWGVGPTAVALKQTGGWTYGILANHIWSVAGDEEHPDVNSTFMQPFLTYTTKDAWTFAVNSEMTYDWTGENWSIPINFQISKLLTIHDQPVSFQAGVRYWARTSEYGPEGFGGRLSVTYLFPTQ
ncbi:transporter [Ancylobacter mangrovi]|uniref:transporter n=1 Tax=Ancylobacter mangrovi TaxID=2972472 RepID=UPI002162D8F3|nr:transporter [Ancylobacter mangrovi]MCS0503334.1 transporter [Ancylobacter mangrovi]